MNTIRRLHALDSVQFSTPNLADQFKISAEAVRRILKSKFRTEEEIEEERVGEALLQEAELGTYDKSQGLPSRLSRRMQDFDHDDKPKYAERKTKPARPLQEGFDAAKLASKYKWAAGSKSSLAKSNPTFVERKWEDSDWDRYDRTIHPADRRDVQSEKRSVLRQRDSVIPS